MNNYIFYNLQYNNDNDMFLELRKIEYKNWNIILIGIKIIYMKRCLQIIFDYVQELWLLSFLIINR